MTPLEPASGEDGPRAGETLDAVGDLRILQRRGGYRFSVDPLLLARFACDGGPALRGPAIDLGTGSGIVPLLLARRGISSVGLELQPALFELAARNVRLNRREGQITVVQGDLRRVRSLFPRGHFQHVLCNPPYHRPERGHKSPIPEKALARHELTCTLGDVAGAARHLLAPRGSLWLILPAARLAELLDAVRGAALAPTRLQWVHPRMDAPARRVLLQAVSQGRGPLEVLPPLFLRPALTERPRLQPSAQAL